MPVPDTIMPSGLGPMPALPAGANPKWMAIWMVISIGGILLLAFAGLWIYVCVLKARHKYVKELKFEPVH